MEAARNYALRREAHARQEASLISEWEQRSAEGAALLESSRAETLELRSQLDESNFQLSEARQEVSTLATVSNTKAAEVLSLKERVMELENGIRALEHSAGDLKYRETEIELLKTKCADVTDDVERITGKPARTIVEHVAEQELRLV